MPIRLLPEEVAARIAAGEVVERPASVIKELVENSLDAGATRLEVETRAGGRTLIRVRDNGQGIPKDEVALAFRRHATSKLETAQDLEHIHTLGFRGEALASIASVSRVTCTTRHAEEPVGTRLRLEGGKLISQQALGWPQGTELRIEDLFYNVPARLKFLRAERTERKHIDAFLTRYAIAYPHIAFTVTHDGRQMLLTAGRGNVREALLEVYGADLGSSLLEIPPVFAENTIQVRGFVGPTTVHRANRGYITLFVNGRWIQDLRLTYAVIQAYHTLLPVKRYPVAFVMITLPAEEVDVNVHPAKTEVRFRNGDEVFRAVQRAVRSTVMDEAPAAASWQAPAPEPAHPTLRQQLAALRPAPQQATLPDLPSARPSPATRPETQPEPLPATVHPPEPFTTAPRRLPPLRVVGQVSTMFIIAEGPDGLYLIDQHAAHERILYEQMIAAWRSGNIPTQALLEPAVVTLPADDAARLEPLLPALHTLGVTVEPFGGSSFLVRGLPAHWRDVDPQTLLADLAANAESHAPSPVQMELEEMLVRRICKKLAVKGGQILSREEMERLVQDLERTENPRTCPHGRPTIIQISLEQLAHQFGR